MKKKIVTLILLFSGVVAYGGKLDVSATYGEISYEEDVSISPTESKWDTTFVELDLRMEQPLSNEGLLRINGSLWFSDEETEQWYENDILNQENDMRALGFEFLGELGSVFSSNKTSTIKGFVGLGYRAQDYQRENFDLVTMPENNAELNRILGDVSEVFSVFYLNTAVETYWQMSSSLSLFLRGNVGYIFYANADNDAVGENIDGEGGYLFGGSGGLSFSLSPTDLLSLGVSYELQHIEGDDVEEIIFDPELGQAFEYQVEWPDNDLERLGVYLGWNRLL